MLQVRVLDLVIHNSVRLMYHRNTNTGLIVCLTCSIMHKNLIVMYRYRTHRKVKVLGHV